MREIHTKYLFVNLLRKFACDLVLDIGSLNGQESLVFKRAYPEAHVVAFEANPYNFRRLVQDAEILATDIEVENFAVWNDDGRVPFRITEVDLQNPMENFGTSSILRHPDVVVREIIEVPCTRIDRFLAGHCPHSRRVAIWMDIEGAEYEALQGIAGSLDRILMIHVETSNTPMREGQKVFRELNEMLIDFGFQSIGSNFDGRTWGDVLYVKKDLWTERERTVRPAFVAARLMRAFPRRRVAGLLFRYAPWLHQWLKRRFRTSPVLSGY
jgi:FkbM family methyltransferase